jgi:two-component system chemotaxis response regulator CheB
MSGAPLQVTRPDPLRVMLCDDSVAARGAMSRMLVEEPSLRIVARVADGRAALHHLDTAAAGDRAEVVLLDLEMPVMDGMTALPLILRRDPRPIVIVASALTQRGASATMAALKAGACDYVPKPTAADGGLAGPGFRDELLAKIKGWAKLGSGPAIGARTRAAQPPRPAQPPRVICIAASTGGPQALAALVRCLPRSLPVPLVLVQHMPAGFTAMLAQHLDSLGGPRIAEARDGDLLRPGQGVLAPGDRHLLIEADGPDLRVVLSEGPAENFCRPAADPTLRSLVAACGRRLHAVVLTGMGQDGLHGCEAVAQAGGTVWAQDEVSSVVWGMPGMVTRAGLAQFQGDPATLGEALAWQLGGAR